MKRVLPSLFLLSVLLFGCQTTDHNSPFLFLPLEADPVDLILPEYPLSFYQYPFEPYENEAIMIPTVLPLPGYTEKKPVATTAITPIKIETPTTTPPVVVLPVSTADIMVDQDQIEDEEMDYSSGEIAIISLEGTDWVFLGEEGAKKTGLADRKISGSKTLFSYLFPQEGEYILLFLRQNNSTGESEEMRMVIHVGPPLEGEIESDQTISTETVRVEAPEVIIAEPQPNSVLIEDSSEKALTKRLEEIEEDPEKVGETLEILEYLVNVESDDDKLAQYYYLMAQALERNSKFQDLRKAYETYQYIEDNFFLTDYYELASERIRYLDRHFFKLR